MKTTIYLPNYIKNKYNNVLGYFGHDVNLSKIVYKMSKNC